MSLFTYLFEHFYSEEQLVQRAGISQKQLQLWQSQALVPLPAYRVMCKVNCESFFGEYQEQQSLSFYAKGTIDWLQQVAKLSDAEQAYAIFKSEYQQVLDKLKNVFGHEFFDTINLGDDHITSEWQHFLNGTYGLCTKSGLAHDIAVKESCIGVIKTLLAKQALNEHESNLLNTAVTMLDQASALFAPHERQGSSRKTYIDDVRRQFELSV